MPVATPDQYAEMLDRAKAGGFAYPAINVSSSQSINAVLQGLAEAGSDGILQAHACVVRNHQRCQPPLVLQQRGHQRVHNGSGIAVGGHRREPVGNDQHQVGPGRLCFQQLAGIRIENTAVIGASEKLIGGRGLGVDLQSRQPTRRQLLLDVARVEAVRALRLSPSGSVLRYGEGEGLADALHRDADSAA